MTFSTPATPLSSSRPPAARAAAAPGVARPSPALWLPATGLALGCALLVLAAGAQAQTPAPTATVAPEAAAAPAEPKYTVAQIAQAFGFIDGNKDGKLSREEAAGFRGVARHFDEADLNKDGALSREEFENALSGDKNR
jgi:hypothetical protein